MTARTIGPLLLAFALLAAGCGGGDTGSTDPSVALRDLTLGAGLDDAGAIEIGWAKREFPLGDPIYLAMNVSDAKENAEIDVQWLGPDDQVLAHEIKRALPEREYMHWEAPPEVALAGLGQYRAKVLYEGKEAATLDFRVTGYEGQEEEPPATPDGSSGKASGSGDTTQDKGSGSGSGAAAGSNGSNGSNGSGGAKTGSGAGTGAS